MLKSDLPASPPANRSGQKARLFPPEIKLAALITMIFVVISAATAAGYYLGTHETVQAADEPVQAQTHNALTIRLEEQKAFCDSVEKINLEQQLVQEQEMTNSLALSLEKQQSAIEQQQTEMNELETRILSTLMSNFDDQLISRSNSSVDGYIEEASNLIDLSRRLSQFSQTDDADEVDLSEYKQAIDNRLLRIPTLRPVYGRISSGFGYRTHPIYRYRHFHSGIDIVASSGTSIRAAATGYVTEAGYHSAMGNYIKISHGNGFTTVYMHSQRLHVSSGQTVEKGQVIATVGSTGSSTGPHLHYEVHLYGTPVNPTRFIME